MGKLKIKPALRSLKRMFEQFRREEAALTARYASDPKHRHVKEILGINNPLGGSKEYVLYWCKVCHTDMGSAIRKKSAVNVQRERAALKRARAALAVSEKGKQTMRKE